MLVCRVGLRPVTLTLLVGYLINIHMQAGEFAAWWPALYAATEGVMQLTLGFFQGTNSLTISAALFAVGLIGLALFIAQRLLARKARTVPTPAPMADRQRLLWAIPFVAAAAIYGATLLNHAGPLPVFIIAGSMMGSFSFAKSGF